MRAHMISTRHGPRGVQMATSDIRPPFDRTRVRYCEHCGSELGHGRFCSSCGHPVVDEADTDELAARGADQNPVSRVAGLEAAERLTEPTGGRRYALPSEPATEVAPPVPG